LREATAAPLGAVREVLAEHLHQGGVEGQAQRREGGRKFVRFEVVQQLFSACESRASRRLRVANPLW
jgi:hypothetical protein